MSVTKGKLEQSGTILVIYGVGGGVICEMAEPRKDHLVSFQPLSLGSPDWGEQMDNANLIVTAVNACKEINPENPQTVAESIKDMYDALKELIAGIESHTEGIGYGREMKIREALAKADEKL